MAARALSHTFLWSPLLLICIGSASATNIIGTYPAIFVFGDSLSDTGNGILSGNPSALRTAQKPYGETFPGWPAFRFTDGHLLVDLLANHLGLPLLNPYLNSSADCINYATSGATALNVSFLGSLDVYPVTDLSLDVLAKMYWQRCTGILMYWQRWTRPRMMPEMLQMHAAFAEGLYVIEFGGNDYINTYLANYPPSFVISTLIPLVIQQIHNAIETLLSMEAKHFLLLTLTPLGCLPKLLTQVDGSKDANGCLEEYNYATYLHGVRVQEEMASLRMLHPDASFLCMDLYGAHDYIVSHKEMFGNVWYVMSDSHYSA